MKTAIVYLNAWNGSHSNSTEQKRKMTILIYMNGWLLLPVLPFFVCLSVCVCQCGSGRHDRTGCNSTQ